MTAIAFVGPALGVHEGWVTTQGEVLAGLFANEGVRTFVSSTSLSPIRRAADHARDLVRWRNEADAAVVSVFSGRAFALADEALTVARALGLPTVAWLHGGNLPDFSARHPRWARRVLAGAHTVVAPSDYLARWAESMGRDALVIPNVLDLDAYTYRERVPLRPRILWMRTFQELYDPATAVLAIAELRRGGIDATLTMAGQDKGLKSMTERLVDELGLGGAVEFPGFVAGSAKRRLLENHDLFLNTNRVDNAPVTVLEAAASGLVVVSSAVGGVSDLLADGESARLVRAGRPLEFANAVTEVLADPVEAGRLATGARHVAEQSTWPLVRDRWESVLGAVA